MTGQSLGFGDGQTLSQNYIGSNQQSLNQLNYNQPYSIDLGTLGSTNISNILQPRISAVSVQQNVSTGAVEQAQPSYDSQEIADEEMPAGNPLNPVTGENFTQKQVMATVPERLSDDEAVVSPESSEAEEVDEEEEPDAEIHVGEDNSSTVAEDNEPDEPVEMGVGKRRYNCTRCNKVFNKASLLRAHVKTHAG